MSKQKGFSAGRASWNLHRRVSYHRRCSRGLHRHHHRHASSRLRLHRHGSHHCRRCNCGWVRSRSETELDSCGSVRNKFAAPSMTAATNSRGCCCCRSAHYVASVVAARKSGCCWNSWGDCYCSLASKVSWIRVPPGYSARMGASPVHWKLKAARLRVPMVDDLHHSNEPLAWARSREDWSFRNLPVRGHDRLHFLARPNCAGYWPHAAKRCCPRHWRRRGSSWSPLRAADSAKGRADEESCQRCPAWSSDGYSLQARYPDDCPLRRSCAMAYSSQGRYSDDCSSRVRCPDGYSQQASCPDDYSSVGRCAIAYSARQRAG